MKLDLGSITFNMHITEGGGTPSWGTALGQNANYNYSVQGVEQLLTSMVYCIIDTQNVFCPLGKGGQQQENSHYELASLYNKVYANGTYIPGAKFVLLIVKLISGDHHVGRRTLKYNSKIKYNNELINDDCYKKIASALGISENGAWLIHSLHTENQDELHFDVVVADKNNTLEFQTSDERKQYILNLLKDDGVESTSITEDIDRTPGGFNKIYYGVPGSGKSYKVNNEFNNDDYKVYRTTFHPEYTNSDFIGQIIPMVKGSGVEYEFHPGAFTNALKYALEHKKEKVCLIIEEINRGNASAIFGDIFQLLDRDEKGKSRYSIFNGLLLDYLNKNGVGIKEIYIPSNMWIVATMNTSDQNVFTLDTAFKRRWKMEYVKNEFVSDAKSTELRNKVIRVSDKYPNVTWETFVSIINEHIISDDSGINGEDKQLGMYFVTVEEINNPKEFAEKILSYLWEDVAKLNKENWFGDIKSYDQLLENYNSLYLEVFDHLFDKQIQVLENIEIETLKWSEGE